MPADRYALTGLPVPVIAPGSFRALEALMKAALTASLKTPSLIFTIKADEGGQRTVIRRYKAGREWTSLPED